MKKYYKGLLMAISMFTVIPLPYYEWDDEGGKNIMKFYPVIGLILGITWYAVYKVLNFIGASTMVTTAVTLIVPFLLTGMLHLDGFMDVCDAILSRRSKEEKLRILKDPHTGAFAVISVVMLFIINFAAMYTVIDLKKNIIGLIVIPIISRSLMGYLLLSKKSMNGSSLGIFLKQGTGKIDKGILMGCLILSSILNIVLFNINGLIAVMAIVSISIFSVDSACKEFDGMSGDTAGYGLVIAETVGVLALSLI